jgi:hypothetical protein
MSSWRILGIALSFAIPAGCAPATGRPTDLPSTPGAYPRADRVGGGPQAVLSARREPGWRPASDAAGTLGVDAPIGNVLAALPAIGHPVPMRSLTWPRPVQLSDVGDAGFTVSGEWIAVAVLVSELRCGVRAEAVRARVVAEVSETGEHVRVESRFEWQGATECEVSDLGMHRLQRAAMDVYLWVRRLAREGTVVPGAA